MARATTMLALVLLVAGAGCGDDDEATGGTRPELAGTVTYKRAGGFSGRTDTLTIRPDGTGTLSSFRIGDEPVKLTAAQLDTLANDLDGADLASVPADTTGPRPVPDAFSHRLTHQGRTIATDDVTMPKDVERVIGELGALVDRFARR